MNSDDAWMQRQQKKGFERNFHAFKGQKISVYGIGKNAMRLLEYGKGFDIVAVAARDHIGEMFHGHVICSLAEAVDTSELMIIAETPKSTDEVFARIGMKVPAGYPVYDLFGRKLKLADARTDISNHSMDGLKKAIDSHDVISFDIFDTLVMRKTLYPKDVFLIEERELYEQGQEVPFAAWRTEAESEQVAEGHLPNFDEIYHYLQERHSLSNEIVHRWKSREWELEKKLIVIRKDMIKAFQYAKMRGKTICLTSDMYFSRQDMECLLGEKGITGYNAVFISCDAQATKAEGSLFRQVVELASGRSILHIGDNEMSDGLIPKRLGIDTYQIQKASDLLEASAVSDALNQVDTLSDRLLLGMILAKVFNSPFFATDSDGRLIVQSVQEFAWLFLLPITMRYLQFIAQTVQQDEDAILLFLSRDGYFLQKEYALLAKKYHPPDSLYFYASRQAANGVMVRDEKDIELFLQVILDRKEWNLKFQLEYFFQIPFEESFDLFVEEALAKWGRKEIICRVKQNKQMIFQAQAEKRKGYLAYLETLHLERYSKAYCVDIVTKGTLIRCLKKLLPQHVDLIAMGGRPALHDCVPDAEACHLMLGIMTVYSVFCPWFPVLEIPYASREGQLKMFSEHGEPVFVKGSEYHRELLDTVQGELGHAMAIFFDADWYRHPLSDGFCTFMLGLLHSNFSMIAEDIVNQFYTSDPEKQGRDFNSFRDLRKESGR